MRTIGDVEAYAARWAAFEAVVASNEPETAETS